ncbi:hypothetical protein CSUB01_10913 [Colletotrichum sublineola]|uniref:Uncharacterized protein n=1 Tax=Colletotrichum sublineola TaxID=1173701 RepID=A0A066Y0I2_COLSU|nr:hypothetical protein CSUB01_10913 [Colletotrichum sublineola]
MLLAPIVPRRAAGCLGPPLLYFYTSFYRPSILLLRRKTPLIVLARCLLRTTPWLLLHRSPPSSAPSYYGCCSGSPSAGISGCPRIRQPDNPESSSEEPSRQGFCYRHVRSVSKERVRQESEDTHPAGLLLIGGITRLGALPVWVDNDPASGRSTWSRTPGTEREKPPEAFFPAAAAKSTWYRTTATPEKAPQGFLPAAALACYAGHWVDDDPASGQST